MCLWGFPVDILLVLCTLKNIYRACVWCLQLKLFIVDTGGMRLVAGWQVVWLTFAPVIFAGSESCLEIDER